MITELSVYIALWEVILIQSLGAGLKLTPTSWIHQVETQPDHEP